jgi:hypothetical protein
MVLQQTTSSGRWRLSHQVRTACGPATKFSRIEQQLAEWVESGEHASRATKDAVEPYLAGYLEQATTAGKRWGSMTGMTVGVALGLVVFFVVLVIR